MGFLVILHNFIICALKKKKYCELYDNNNLYNGEKVIL